MSAYGHDFRKISHDHYRLSWMIDRKYASSRLRFPTAFDRDTDEAGAKRFAKKWGLGWNEPPRSPQVTEDTRHE